MQLEKQFGSRPLGQQSSGTTKCDNLGAFDVELDQVGTPACAFDEGIEGDDRHEDPVHLRCILTVTANVLEPAGRTEYKTRPLIVGHDKLGKAFGVADGDAEASGVEHSVSIEVLPNARRIRRNGLDREGLPGRAHGSGTHQRGVTDMRADVEEDVARLESGSQPPVEGSLIGSSPV